MSFQGHFPSPPPGLQASSSSVLSSVTSAGSRPPWEMEHTNETLLPYLSNTELSGHGGNVHAVSSFPGAPLVDHHILLCLSNTLRELLTKPCMWAFSKECCHLPTSICQLFPTTQLTTGSSSVIYIDFFVLIKGKRIKFPFSLDTTGANLVFTGVMDWNYHFVLLKTETFSFGELFLWGWTLMKMSLSF